MTKHKFLIVIIVGLIGINLLTIFTLSQKPPHQPPKDKIIADLGFDEEQAKSYELLITEHRATIESIEEQIKSNKTKLYGILAEDNYKEKDAVIATLANLQQQIEQAHFAHFDGIKSICKPEQKDKFKSLTKNLAKYFAPHHPPKPHK